MNTHSHIDRAAREVLEANRVAVFIVAYNASKHIASVLNRIPSWVSEELVEIYLIDDSSKDDTALIASQINWPTNFAPLRVFKTPFNQGYGGNQKIGYNYAIKQNFDIVVLLHGDGQYAPEALPHLLSEYVNGADAVFGSRFINAGGALKGGMPLYKFIGNRVLSGLQNYFMKGSLSEWHSGYRSYRTSLLKRVPFSCNSNDFDFDAEIIIQTLGAGGVIKEVPIPTFYGDEICHVNGMRYAVQCMKNVLQYRAMQAELFFDPRFDLSKYGQESKQSKKCAVTTINGFIENLNLPTALKILEFDAMNHELGFNQSPNSVANEYDVVVALDTLQNQSSPELALLNIGKHLKANGLLYVSCANVAYFPVRLMLFFGFFNYGRKGVLDRAHHRLFTKGSFRRLLLQGGFEVEMVHGFGPPIIDRVGQSLVLRLLDKASYFLARSWVSLFAFEILFIAKKRVDIEWLLQKTTAYTNKSE
ncbi:glycosyltransferase [Polynucleobacter sp. es-EL-1]|uniref:glycosyltransferase n=1 Tax=Polynucleobacter sp. es-EL-1 TaxID=1855652 RepID=UPI001BFD2E2A|nr:glycosyltransferase [Polynucleobacter sp. es-EL-1]QWE10872.1 glycosyltransferase [Polynucleobacter sp. es-EL-1]